MRSPQFLEGIKQWMDNAINFRKLSNDFMARVRNELQAPSREDIDTVMLSVRHMEKRLLDRVEELSAQIEEINRRLGNGEVAKASFKQTRRAATRTRKAPTKS